MKYYTATVFSVGKLGLNRPKTILGVSQNKDALSPPSLQDCSLMLKINAFIKAEQLFTWKLLPYEVFLLFCISPFYATNSLFKRRKLNKTKINPLNPLPSSTTTSILLFLLMIFCELSISCSLFSIPHCPFSLECLNQAFPIAFFL